MTGAYAGCLNASAWASSSSLCCRRARKIIVQGIIDSPLARVETCGPSSHPQARAGEALEAIEGYWAAGRGEPPPERDGCADRLLPLPVQAAFVSTCRPAPSSRIPVMVDMRRYLEMSRVCQPGPISLDGNHAPEYRPEEDFADTLGKSQGGSGREEGRRHRPHRIHGELDLCSTGCFPAWRMANRLASRSSLEQPPHLHDERGDPGLHPDSLLAACAPRDAFMCGSIKYKLLTSSSRREHLRRRLTLSSNLYGNDSDRKRLLSFPTR